MEISTDDGNTYTIDINNAMHPTTLLGESVNTDRGNALNAAGVYQHKAGSVLTQDKPVNIYRVGTNQLGVSGMVYRWDEDAEMGVFDDLNMYFENNAALSTLNPEQLEQYIDNIYRLAEKDYNANNEIVTE